MIGTVYPGYKDCDGGQAAATSEISEGDKLDEDDDDDALLLLLLLETFPIDTHNVELYTACVVTSNVPGYSALFKVNNCVASCPQGIKVTGYEIPALSLLATASIQRPEAA